MRYEEFASRELPRRTKAELDARLELRGIRVDDEVKCQLVRISNEIQLKLLEDFRLLQDRSSGPHSRADEDDYEPSHETSSNRVASAVSLDSLESTGFPEIAAHDTFEAQLMHNTDGLATASSLIADQQAHANRPPDIPWFTSQIPNQTSMGDKLACDSRLPPHYFEDTSWNPTDISWSSVFSNVDNNQSGSASAGLPTTISRQEWLAMTRLNE